MERGEANMQERNKVKLRSVEEGCEVNIKIGACGGRMLNYP